MNYKQIFAIQNKNKKRLRSLFPYLNDMSGIYVFYRVDEDGIRYAYVGQAKQILTRLAQHLAGYQAIDLSIKKHGLYEASNPHGYKIRQMNFPVAKLDDAEQYYVREYALQGYQLRNKTAGGQKSKRAIADVETKTYSEGVHYGEIKALRRIKVYFDKYLDFSIKGATNKVKERKIKEFIDLLDEIK